MKKLYLLLLSTSILFASCTRNDEAQGENGPFGEVSVLLRATEATENLSKAAKAGSDTVVLDPADFKIEFVNSTGLVSKHYDRYGDMPQTVKLNVGSYKLRAYYGSAASCGFAAPYFLGEKEFTVDGQTNKNISVTCTLANAKLDVEYGGQIQQDYADFRVEVKPASLGAVAFSKTETRPAYFPVGPLGIAIYLSTDNGERVYNYPDPITVEARQFMHLKIDTKDAKGDLTLSIQTDNSTIDTTVTVELASFTRPKEAPSITLDGFDESGRLSFAEGVRQPAAMNISAKGGIKTCLVTVQSPALLAKGWPASFDLAALDAGTGTVLKRDGLRWTEKMQNASMATIDFSDLTEILTAEEASAAEHAFTVNVTDTVRNTQTSGDVKAVFTVTPPVFSLSSVTAGDLWTDHATLTVDVPSGVMRKAVAEWKTAGGSSWTPCTGSDSVRNGTAVTFTATGLPAASALQFRVRYNDRYTEVREGTTEQAVQLPNPGLENWSEWYNRTINNGGKIAVTAGTKQLTKSVTASEAGGGWATTNRKTVPESPANENTWYVVPSVLPATGSSGTGALIRNVAWDNNGKAPANASWGNIGFQGSLSKLDAPSIGFRSAGKLFLGSYAYDHSNNSETYTEGLQFPSRPSALTGYYKYTAKGGDAAGKVFVTVEHRTAEGGVTTLARAEQELPGSDEYKPFTVSLNYTDKSLKATHIKVMFASSSKASYDQSAETQAIQTEDIKSEAVSLGSELYIDELNLNY